MPNRNLIPPYFTLSLVILNFLHIQYVSRYLHRWCTIRFICVSVYLLHWLLGSIIVYRLNGNLKPTQLNRFCQKLYGQDTTTHGGRYKYRKRGLLDDIPNWRLIRGVLVLFEEDKDLVLNFLKEWGAETYVWTVELDDGDIKAIRTVQQ